jgi:hypothetical protein
MRPLILEFSPEDYENGVADLLAEKFGRQGIVERNVRLPSRSGARPRQIDVLVRLPLADFDDALMVVDCKRYGRKVNVKDVEAFIGLVNDVGAPMGLMVTTEGFTRGAIGRVSAERGIRVQVVGVEDLPRWEPPLVLCDLCAEATHEDAPPGVAYVDSPAEFQAENGFVVATVGYCDKCDGLHLECPVCETVNSVSEWREDQWVECEGGCGAEWFLRRAMSKDDLVSPAHSRLTVRLHDG